MSKEFHFQIKKNEKKTLIFTVQRIVTTNVSGIIEFDNNLFL